MRWAALNKRARALVAGLAFGAGLLGLAPVAAQFSPTAIPAGLHVPSQNVRHLTTHATGSQVYVCVAQTDNPYSFGWTFKEPVADLLDEHGEKVGHHYDGPTWEWHDGSTVVGRVMERAPAPTSGAIPWLLLRATSGEGDGQLTPISYIQRIETVGGAAPSDACNQKTADTEVAVPYTATYVFYASRTDPQ